ncbi:MAG: citrate transporter, partial [Firmicutes bacterium]|nr:citrate transporter [Bacillota bacterium]
YSFYHLHIFDFMKTVLPVGIIGYIIVMCILFACKNAAIEVSIKERADIGNKKPLLAYFVCIFILSVLTVLRIIDYRICIAIVFVSMLILDRRLLKKVDYGLLLTFAAFFVFVGNLEQLHIVKGALAQCLAGRVLETSILSSQLISNVPAAMMISRFTGDARDLLLGVNIGGIGTPIASLASLISFRLYAQSDNSAPAQYLGVFTVYNAVVLLLLVFAAVLL